MSCLSDVGVPALSQAGPFRKDAFRGSENVGAIDRSGSGPARVSILPSLGSSLLYDRLQLHEAMHHSGRCARNPCGGNDRKERRSQDGGLLADRRRADRGAAEIVFPPPFREALRQVVADHLREGAG